MVPSATRSRENEKQRVFVTLGQTLPDTFLRLGRRPSMSGVAESDLERGRGGGGYLKADFSQAKKFCGNLFSQSSLVCGLTQKFWGSSREI